MDNSSLAVIRAADRLVRECGTSNPHVIADMLNITVIYKPFRKQKGVYKTILRNHFVFLREDMDDRTEKIVLTHEIAHHVLHRGEGGGYFAVYDVFDVKGSRMEYEANLFTACVLLDEEEFIELCRQGLDSEQIAAAMDSDVNLVALRSDTLIEKGYAFAALEHRNDFLK